MFPGSHPILSCDNARALEEKLFAGDEAREWPAMQRAGQAVAAAVGRDFGEIGGFPPTGRILVLAGKGHNGGDALIAAQAILEKFPQARVDVMFVFGERALRPLAMRAWQGLTHAVGQRACARPGNDGAGARADLQEGAYDLCLDGVFGFQFRPPAEPRVAALLVRVNTLPIRLRAAVDLPSAGLFRADFTYATGCVKSPVLTAPEAGRVRYLDLGFFAAEGTEPNARDWVLTSSVLAPLGALRAPQSDKRSHGHVFVVGGSRQYPGAVLMTVLAALRSGAGLVTAFVPESLVPAFAARAPEAMWVGWPVTSAGGLALEGETLLRARIERAHALVIGPGMGREPETLALVRRVVESSAVPLVIDADALQPEIVRTGGTPRIITPHAGEFARIAGGAELREFVSATGATVVLKGPVTRIASGAKTEWRLRHATVQGGSGVPPLSQRRDASATLHDSSATRSSTRPTEEICVYHSFFGGPVLARGGSGDVLAGLIGGLLAQDPADPLLAAARGAVWHGTAADLLARAHGQVAVHTTQLLDFLAPALREP